VKPTVTMEWIKIFSSETEAKKNLLDSAPRLVVIGEKRICLVSFNSNYYAVQDSCSHNGESLSKGKINYLGEIICPWHNYRFELKSGRPCDSDCSDLRTYPIRVDSSGFFIGI
jgi:nitrite reductase/ring-hydroxylating ferredoxin subunit